MIRKRYPLNMAGDFYVEDGCCTACCLPLHEAPDLIAEPLEENDFHCYFKKQPETVSEVKAALRAIMVAELQCLRYGGVETSILSRLVRMHEGGVCDALEGKSPAEIESSLGIAIPPKPIYEFDE